MKLNLIIKICLGVSVFLLVGVFLVQAHGFISYEDGNKIIVWDPLRLIGKGLKMSNEGVNDLENVEDGILKIEDKDLFIRKFMAFDCNNYPQVTDCATTIGDIGGNTFLSINKLTGNDLIFNSPGGFSLNEDGDGLIVNGKIFLNNGASLIATNLDYSAIETDNNVITNSLKTDHIQSAGSLSLPGLFFTENAVFELKRLIELEVDYE